MRNGVQRPWQASMATSLLIKENLPMLRVVLLAILLLLVSSCSVRKYALHEMSSLFSGASEVFGQEEDPELAAEAMPFTLKLLEVIQRQDPQNSTWYLNLGKGFIQYAYLVANKADQLESVNLEEAERLRSRAKALYARGLRALLSGIGLIHPGLAGQLRAEPERAVSVLTSSDMEWIYWIASGWGGLISLSKQEPLVLADIAQLTALIRRGEELNPDWGAGAFHTLLIRFETSRPELSWQEAVALAWRHFKQAVLLSGGKDASPFVVMAEAVAVQEQDVELFESLLRQALAIDSSLYPEYRLVNELMQRRARWLLSRREELFLISNQ